MKTAFIFLAAALLLVSSPAGEDFTFLVNAQNPLPPDHAPADLVRVRHARAGREDICKMRKTAAQALDEMLDAAAFIYENSLALEEYRAFAQTH